MASQIEALDGPIHRRRVVSADGISCRVQQCGPEEFFVDGCAASARKDKVVSREFEEARRILRCATGEMACGAPI